MSQTPGEQPGPSATARAEGLWDNMGSRIGLFVAQAGQRIQSVATSIREEADQLDQAGTPPGENSHPPTIARTQGEEGKLAMERAEDLVERFGQRLGHFTALAGFQVQKTGARMREEVEDMWAEAQNIRQQRSRPPQ